MIKGQGLTILWSEALTLLGLGVGMTVAAILLFRKRIA
jgi:hypothetical protein